jgi:hypothetical protein
MDAGEHDLAGRCKQKLGEPPQGIGQLAAAGSAAPGEGERCRGLPVDAWPVPRGGGVDGADGGWAQRVAVDVAPPQQPMATPARWAPGWMS